MTGNDDATTGEPIGYSAVTRGNASPMFCVDCGEDANREVEPMTSDDMEAFDTAKCALCGATFYPPEEAVDLPFDPTDEEFMGEDMPREHALVPGNVLDAVDEADDLREAFEEFARFLDRRGRAGYPLVSVEEAGQGVLLVLDEFEGEEADLMSWANAQERAREFYDDMRAVVPLARDGLNLYDEGNYGPRSDRNNVPNVEVITTAESVFDMANETGAFTFRDLLEKHGVAVLDEVDLRNSESEAKTKAYVGVPATEISAGKGR